MGICRSYLHIIDMSPVLVVFYITVKKCLSRNKSVKERFVSVPGMRDMVLHTRGHAVAGS